MPLHHFHARLSHGFTVFGGHIRHHIHHPPHAFSFVLVGQCREGSNGSGQKNRCDGEPGF